MTEHRICRFCKESASEDNLVKYGTRHYAHHACYLDHKPLHELHGWQVGNFPWLLIINRGLEKEALECMKK
jgi:hypothetical protein